jgi:hypothetical protein
MLMVFPRDDAGTVAIGTSAATMLSLLSSLRGLSQLGLDQNTLYDVLDDNLGHGNVSVNSHTVDVICGSLANGSADPVSASNLPIPEAWLVRSPDGGDDLFTITVPTMGKCLGEISLLPNSFELTWVCMEC